MKRQKGFTLVELLIRHRCTRQRWRQTGRISGHIMRKYKQIICLPSNRIRKLKRIGIQIPTMTGIR